MRPIPESRTKKGPHGGGTEFDELKIKPEFTNLAKQAPQEKDEPGIADEPTIDPGDGAKGGKKAEAGTVKGFKAAGGDMKEKDKPGKVTKSETTIDSALDDILAEAVGTTVAFKAPDVLGTFGAPSDADLDKMEREIDGELCTDCEDDPADVPEAMPGGEPMDVAARMAALGDFDDWAQPNHHEIPPRTLGRVSPRFEGVEVGAWRVVGTRHGRPHVYETGTRAECETWLALHAPRHRPNGNGPNGSVVYGVIDFSSDPPMTLQPADVDHAMSDVSGTSVADLQRFRAPYEPEELL